MKWFSKTIIFVKNKTKANESFMDFFIPRNYNSYQL